LMRKTFFISEQKVITHMYIVRKERLPNFNFSSL